MPIPETIARRQMKRFEDYPQFPETEAGVRELLKAFVASCRDDHDAEAVGDLLVRSTHDFCPRPAHVYDAADTVHRGSEDLMPEFTSVRRPGDEPFNGFADLIDDRLLELLRRKAEHGKSPAERAALRQFLEIRENARRPGGDA